MAHVVEPALDGIPVDDEMDEPIIAVSKPDKRRNSERAHNGRVKTLRASWAILVKIGARFLGGKVSESCIDWVLLYGPRSGH